MVRRLIQMPNANMAYGAHLNTFKKLLCRTGYDLNNDHLFLLGDLMEKGPDNLATLRFIMELAQHEKRPCFNGKLRFCL